MVAMRAEKTRHFKVSKAWYAPWPGFRVYMSPLYSITSEYILYRIYIVGISHCPATLWIYKSYAI